MSKKLKPNLNIALVGSAGRMGLEIEALSESSAVKICAKIDDGKDWRNASASDVNVVVDFSTPDGLLKAIGWCVKNKKPLVSGTTGLKEKHFAALNKAKKHIPILWSGNMSLGVAVFNAMMKSLNAVRDWDFQIEEIHHSKKKDSPSGTALLLHTHLEKAIGKKAPQPLSVRGGGVPGVHTLFAMGANETLSIQHTAFNRQVFATGALKAADWLFDKKQAGLYDLSDLYKA